MSQSYTGRPDRDPPPGSEEEDPFPFIAAASHAWKQDTDRQLFGPIELSQHCV